MRGARYSQVSVAVAAALLLSACASDSSFTIAGRKPNPKAFEEDASSCSGVFRSVGHSVGSAFVGAANGAALGVVGSGGRPDAAAVGAIAGGTLGLLIGAGIGIADSVDGDGYDACMKQKGYQRTATTLVVKQDLPVIERLEPPRLVAVPERHAADPAR